MITIYTDGSCLTNPGNGGWAAIINDGKNMIGKKLFAVSPLKNTSIEVEIISSHYVDPVGKRVRS